MKLNDYMDLVEPSMMTAHKIKMEKQSDKLLEELSRPKKIESDEDLGLVVIFVMAVAIIYFAGKIFHFIK